MKFHDTNTVDSYSVTTGEHGLGMPQLGDLGPKPAWGPSVGLFCANSY